MIKDQITKAIHDYMVATKSKPSRIYLGIKQRLELEALVEAHPSMVDVTRDQVMGVRVYRVNETTHMYVAGDLNHD